MKQMSLLWAMAATWSAALGLCGAEVQKIRIGFLDPAVPQETSRRNAAALAFAQTRGQAVRIWFTAGKGWLDPDHRPHALEEFDVIWYHQAENVRNMMSDPTAREDLLCYLEGGGVALLSGAAGALLNDLGVESTPLRVLGPTEAAFTSGIRIRPAHRAHPIFSGLDTAKPIPFTSVGGNALADFYGTAGPHGELLADGNASAGERPVVEYRVGDGRAIFVGWRLADFCTATDAYRPNLERFFCNVLAYLSGGNTNRARMILPPGGSRYVRRLGVPFLQAEKPFALKETPRAEEKFAAVIADKAIGTAAYPLEDGFVSEVSVAELPARVMAVTFMARHGVLSEFMAKRRAEQETVDRRDKELMDGLRIVKPVVRLIPAPLRPLQTPRVHQSVLLGYSAFMAPGEGKGDITPVYEPVEDGGFRISKSRRRLNRPIVHGQNRVWTGDVPIFLMDTVTGNGSYARDERVFPLWPRPDAHIGNVNPCMGTLRLGVVGADGKEQWLDENEQTTTLFRPGYTEYQVNGGGWKASLLIAPSMDFHGFVCRAEFDKEVALVWRYGGMWWQATEANANRVEIQGNEARITEPNLPNGLVLVGWDGEGEGRALAAPFGQQAEFRATRPRRAYHVVGAWGVTRYDEDRARKTMARLDTPNASAWPEKRDYLKQLWFDCYIKRALDPEAHFRVLLSDPERELQRIREWWDRRREEFQIRTPDPHFNALINWARCVSEYHRQGPGLVLGAQIWQMYSHISVGWYGKQWGGDHQAIEDCLRFYGALQGEDGFIRWISPSLVAFHAENNTPYWVDQVWRHYTWTGDRRFLKDMWPIVRKAVAWMRWRNDPDGDGLFRDFYEYWNCDSNGKGPKAAAPSAMAWAMFDRAARIAGVLGDPIAEREYRALAEKTRNQIFRELWNDEEGLLGSIGADGIWRGHPQIWEEYLAVNAGLLGGEQGRRAMQWLASHYGFEPNPGIKLLACSDWWPIRWSVQWVPTGDTCLAALAGMKSGDADLWWPFLKTVVGSAFRSEFPGINMGISNAGAGGGDREDVDSDDPHVHVAVRGLFGIEPALHEGRLDICPAFPSDWREASIRTPDVSYEYRREGNRATFTIRTPRPLVKRVRPNWTGAEVVTPPETESAVTLSLGPAMTPSIGPEKPSILMDEVWKAQKAMAATPAIERNRQILFDLSGAYNVTLEELVGTKFVFDYADAPQPLFSWWGNPSLTLPPCGRVVESPSGVLFLASGRPRSGLGATPKNLVALASWKPYPFPGGVLIPIGLRCERVWLLLQCYVHPIKNYIPNGEVVIHYTAGPDKIESLIPPFNLDCYFQHFSLKGHPVPFGRLGPWPTGWTPIHKGLAGAHADALEIMCDATLAVESLELRATCSEGVLGLAGLTVLEAK